MLPSLVFPGITHFRGFHQNVSQKIDAQASTLRLNFSGPTVTVMHSTCGLYYKHVMIVTDASSDINK